MGKKDDTLGMPHGTAAGRLRKLILFDLLRQLDQNKCYRCDNTILTADQLSIEHKEPWESRANGRELFWSLDNIAFSHIKCNSGAGRRYKIPGSMQERRKRFRAAHPEQDTKAYRRAHGWGV